MVEKENKEELELINDETLETEPPSISRRDFLKLSGTALGAFLLPSNIRDFFTSFEIESDLSEAAKSYIAKTPQEATRVSEALRGKGSSPSNICGPLSVAIMLDWRLQNDLSVNVGDSPELSGISPKDMWLASPGGESTNPKLFEYAFPSDKYDAFRVTENIGRVDFNNLEDIGKLKPGDFMYLSGGSFTHFITISRQDKQGRLYATSNIHTSKINEFIIDEVMLWDPNTKTGFFRDWASGVGAERARTGIDGFYLWRKKEKGDNMAKDMIVEKYRNWFVNRLREQKKGIWNVHIQELGGKELFEWRDGMGYHPASTIKTPIALAVMKNINEQYVNEIRERGLEAVLNERGFEGRTFKQLFNAMLVNSEEEATEHCVNFVNNRKKIDENFKEMNLLDTTYLPRRSSQRDLYKAWEEIFLGNSLTKESKGFLIGLLGQYTKNDDTLLGTLKNNFQDIDVWNKRGAVVTGGLYTIQDTGIVRIGNRYFYLGFAGTSVKSAEATDTELGVFIEEMCSAFASYVKESTNTQRRWSIRNQSV